MMKRAASSQTAVEPIHVEAIGLANVRFFRSPLDGPRQPWHAIDDIYAAMVLPRELRRVLKSKMLKHRKWKKSILEVKTDGGELLIAPHWMAQGLIGMGVDCTGLSPDFEHRYVTGMMKAMEVITEGMTPIDSVNYGIAAFRNENGLPPAPPLEAKSVIIDRKGL